jgi:Fungal Zn(2)-Cys(6) binuclear cluster domain
MIQPIGKLKALKLATDFPPFRVWYIDCRKIYKHAYPTSIPSPLHFAVKSPSTFRHNGVKLIFLIRITTSPETIPKSKSAPTCPFRFSTPMNQINLGQYRQETQPKSGASLNDRSPEEQQLQSPPRKRQRIPSACEPCRRRKTRCDGNRPVCSPCLRRGYSEQLCMYRRDEPRDLEDM